jgi:SAM-dependent methyltransferase
MTDSSYDPAYFELLSAIEDQHFWFRTRRAIISSIVKQITAEMKPGYRVLEIGCGTGNVLRVLEDACPDGVVVGMDLFSEGLKYARGQTSCSLVQGDIQALPFGKKFDLIGLFDVLEHIPDDIKALANLRALLADDGFLLLTVPAHQSLWGSFDIFSHHCRRYELNELENKLNQTGYEVEYLTYYMASIFPLVWIERRLKERFDPRSAEDQASDEFRIVPVINELLAILLTQETHLIARRKRLPFGTSIVAIAYKNNLRIKCTPRIN